MISQLSALNFSVCFFSLSMSVFFLFVCLFFFLSLFYLTFFSSVFLSFIFFFLLHFFLLFSFFLFFFLCWSLQIFENARIKEVLFSFLKKILWQHYQFHFSLIIIETPGNLTKHNFLCYFSNSFIFALEIIQKYFNLRDQLC